MLRISVVNGPLTHFRLEGKLANEWVQEARTAWLSIAGRSGTKRVIVDLLGVTFVDEPGRRLLLAIHRDGGNLQGAGPMMSALIAEIKSTKNETGEDWRPSQDHGMELER